MKLLVADIGGTNARFAYREKNNSDLNNFAYLKCSDYENIYDDTDANISFAKDILFTYQYLNSLNVKNYHIVPKDEYRFKYKWYNIDKLLSFNVQDIRMQYPKALDNQHPDEQAQQAIAEAIYNEIVNDVT